MDRWALWQWDGETPTCKGCGEPCTVRDIATDSVIVRESGLDHKVYVYHEMCADMLWGLGWRRTASFNSGLVK